VLLLLLLLLLLLVELLLLLLLLVYCSLLHTWLLLLPGAARCRFIRAVLLPMLLPLLMLPKQDAKPSA